MSVSNNVGGKGSGLGVGVSGVASVAVGAATLANTGDSQTVSVLAVLAVIVGSLAVISHTGVRAYKRFVK